MIKRGFQFGGVIPGGSGSAAPIVIPKPPFAAILRSLYFTVASVASVSWKGSLQWLDGEGNVVVDVFSEGRSTVFDSAHSFFCGAWAPSGGSIALVVPTDPDNVNRCTWALPDWVCMPGGDKVQLLNRGLTPSDVTLSSIRYRWERVEVSGV